LADAGNDPAHYNGAHGQPWTMLGGRSIACRSHGADRSCRGRNVEQCDDLSWNASVVPGNGVVTGYAIFENDHQIATVTGTSYTVANLTANTTYTFSVAALDAQARPPRPIDLGAYDPVHCSR
jgi:hypothetical protein